MYDIARHMRIHAHVVSHGRSSHYSHVYRYVYRHVGSTYEVDGPSKPHLHVGSANEVNMMSVTFPDESGEVYQKWGGGRCRYRYYTHIVQFRYNHMRQHAVCACEHRDGPFGLPGAG